MDKQQLGGIYYSDAAEAVARRRDEITLAHRRQADAAAYDMRALGGFIVSALFSSDDPERFAGLNAGVRVPTTLDHPNAVVGKAA